MAPATGVSPSSDRIPMMMPVQPEMMPAAYAKDAIISWFRGEFAAANAIIDALCGHLTQLEGGRCEYESVFAAIHRRRLNWIPILQMQKYYSIADVVNELQKVVEEKTRGGNGDENHEIEDVNVDSEKKVDVAFECGESGGNGDAEAVDVDFNRDDSRSSEITDSGSHEVQLLEENNDICSNQEEDWEARRAQIKMTKGFVAKESVKGHMVNVVRGLKVYEDILNDSELSSLNEYVNELRLAGQNGELSGGPVIRDAFIVSLVLSLWD